MSVIRSWYVHLPEDVQAGVKKFIGLAREPSDEQLAEAVDLAEKDFCFDIAGLTGPLRDKVEAAIRDLALAMKAADPRHRFLRNNDGQKIHPRLRRFYDEREHVAHQNRALEGLRYRPYPLYVDFDDIAWLRNPDSTAATIGAQHVPWANLAEKPGGDNSECYAHLVIDPVSTVVLWSSPRETPSG